MDDLVVRVLERLDRPMVPKLGVELVALALLSRLFKDIRSRDVRLSVVRVAGARLCSCKRICPSNWLIELVSHLMAGRVRFRTSGALQLLDRSFDCDLDAWLSVRRSLELLRMLCTRAFTCFNDGGRGGLSLLSLGSNWARLCFRPVNSDPPTKVLCRCRRAALSAALGLALDSGLWFSLFAFGSAYKLALLLLLLRFFPLLAAAITVPMLNWLECELVPSRELNIKLLVDPPLIDSFVESYTLTRPVSLPTPLDKCPNVKFPVDPLLHPPFVWTERSVVFEPVGLANGLPRMLRRIREKRLNESARRAAAAKFVSERSKSFELGFIGWDNPFDSWFRSNTNDAHELDTFKQLDEKALLVSIRSRFSACNEFNKVTLEWRVDRRELPNRLNDPPANSKFSALCPTLDSFSSCSNWESTESAPFRATPGTRLRNDRRCRGSELVPVVHSPVVLSPPQLFVRSIRPVSASFAVVPWLEFKCDLSLWCRLALDPLNRRCSCRSSLSLRRSFSSSALRNRHKKREKMRKQSSNLNSVKSSHKNSPSVPKRKNRTK